MGRIGRRAFIRTGAGAAALAGVAACGNRGATQPRPSTPGGDATRSLIDPNDAPFDHVVALTLSSRSFDHLLGWLSGADGRQRGLVYRNAAGAPHRTHSLAGDPNGCGPPAAPHEWIDGAVHLGDDEADGFLRTVRSGDVTPLGYYPRRAVPVTARLATSFATLGNYFASLNAGAVPNRMYLHAAATDVDVDGRSAIATTIWDHVRDAGLSGRYYAAGAPFTARFDSGSVGDATRSYERFLTDARAGDLPNVAFVDPADSPQLALGTREAIVAEVFGALRRGPQWGRSVLVIHYDQWGGYFDHVPPPKVIDDNVNPAPGPHPDYSQLGFRVPCIVASPFAPHQALAGGEGFEHCSILRMIEWRWDLPALTARDRNARNLAEVLDFTRALPSIGPIAYRRQPSGPGCTGPAPPPS